MDKERQTGTWKDTCTSEKFELDKWMGIKYTQILANQNIYQSFYTNIHKSKHGRKVLIQPK